MNDYPCLTPAWTDYRQRSKENQEVIFFSICIQGVLTVVALCSPFFNVHFLWSTTATNKVLRFVRQGGHADNSASSGVAKQVQFMKMNSRKVRSQRRQFGSELNCLLSISFMSNNLQNPNKFLRWKLRAITPTQWQKSGAALTTPAGETISASAYISVCLPCLRVYIWWPFSCSLKYK